MIEHTLPGFLESALYALCTETATPRALTVAMLWKFGEWDQLASLSCDPSHYSNPNDYFRDVVVTDLLRKMEDLPTSFDRPKVAEDNFWLCEKSCYNANERLSPYLYGSSDPANEDRILEFFKSVRKNVTLLLGPAPPADLVGRFGPGATFADRGTRTTVPHKMSSRPTLTTNACYYLFPWVGTAWASACATLEMSPLFVKGNRFTTVPKDCRKDRGIAVEPSINVFFQLALGRALRHRLQGVGLDLDYAQDVHRRVACEASIRGHLCTMDLSNASDTICTNLVKLILPSRWFAALADLRSTHTLIGGRWVRLEKFSSMGNGYTFELETVIFLAVIMSVMEQSGHKPVIHENIFVFGDDLIFPNELASEVKAVLNFIGLTVNETKTFVNGSFRESCGGDFFDGMDVRPFYLKESPSEPQQVIAFANGIRKLGKKRLAIDPLAHGYRRCWFSILDALPTPIRRLRGPEVLGDLLVHDEESRWQPRWRHSIRYFQTYRPSRHRKVAWDRFNPEVILASATYSPGWGSAHPKGWAFAEGITPRDSVLGYKIGWTPAS